MKTMKFELKTTGEIAQALAKRMRELRLRKKWKRTTLADRSGVSKSSLRRFEQTGKISLESFLKLMSTFDRLFEMEKLLQPPAVKSIDDLETRKKKLPKRGSI